MEAKTISDLVGLLRSHMNDFNEQTKIVLEMNEKITLLLQAFPENGGVIGHRVYHENVIRASEDRRQVDQAVKGAVLGRWANVGILVVILGAWEFVKRKMGLP